MVRLLGVIFFFFIFAVSPVYAVTVSLSTPSASIDQDQELSLNISLSCPGCGDSYFRGVFFETSENYFGLTQNNNGEWIGTSSNRTKYFKVAKEEIIDNAWSGGLKVKVEKDSLFYKGPGTYSVKVGRYTSSSGSTVYWSDSYYLNITGPTPTPTTTPIPSLNPTNTPTPTMTPAPTKLSTPIPTRTPTPTIRPSPTATETPILAATTSGEVLSLSDSASPTPTATPSASLKPIIISFSLIGAGFGILSLYFLWQKRNLHKDDIIP